MRTVAAVLVVLLGVVFARPAAADHTLKRIKETKVINLGYDNAPPFSGPDENGTPTGYTIELCELIVTHLREELGVPDLEIRWKAVEVNRRIDDIVEGMIDILCGAMTDTLSRAKRIDFSHLIYVGGGGVVVLASSGITSIEQLAGKRIAVLAKSSNQAALEQFVAKLGKGTKIMPVSEQAAGIAAVESGTADAYNSDRITLIGMLANKFKNNLLVLDQYISYEPLALGMRNNDPQFRAAVNRALSRIYRTSQINDLVKRWLSPTGKQDPLLTSLFLLGVRPE